MTRQFQNVLSQIDNARVMKIFGQSANFNVPGIANYDREIAGRHETFQLIMRVSNKRTSSIDHVEAAFPPNRAFRIGSTVSGYHYAP